MTTIKSESAEAQAGMYAADIEQALVAGLRRGDERAFETLILRYHTALVRLARVWVRDAPAAEEVAQETWLAVVQGVHAFQGRSPLQSWIFGILANKAKRRGKRESWSRPFSEFGADVNRDATSAMDPEFFFPAGHEWAGHWIHPLADREGCPERYVLASEMGRVILRKIDELPTHYRGVILLRDLHGFTGAETCTLLGISANTQRVMLHRARTKLRLALDPYLNGTDHVAQSE